MSNRKLLYFADPMCSWCWGFSPAIHEAANQFADVAPVEIHVGGLRAGNTKIMDKEQRLYILNHWFNVNEASGQPFEFAFNMPEGFVYNTEPACRAVKTIQQLNRAQALNYFSAIQQAFYAKNVDVTNPEILTELATEYGVTEQQFDMIFNSDEIKQQTQNDFMLTQQMRVNGFPSVIGHGEQGYMFLAQGFQLYPQLENTINRWLEIV